MIEASAEKLLNHGSRGHVLAAMGSNLGKPLGQLRLAVSKLEARLGMFRTSSVYRSAPVGYLNQPDFLNIVCVGRSVIPASELLRKIREIEVALGRTRSFPNAPRTIDIDILACGDLVLDTPDLILPHPRLHQRAFVLAPLAEIAPEWRHPVFGKTAAELLSAAGPLERIERVGPLPG